MRVCSALKRVPSVSRIAFLPQAAILVLFNVLSILFIFPAMLSLDLRRRRARAYDIICCWSDQPASDAAEPCGAPAAAAETTTPATTVPPTAELGGKTTAAPTAVAGPRCTSAVRWPGLPYLVRRYYTVWLLRRPVRALVLLTSLAAAGLGVWGAAQLRDGLDLTDVVPRGSDEFAFIEAQRRYFGFFEMVAVTQGDFEYPTHQELLHQYHQAFTRVPSVIKNDDGGLPDFWLSLFRDWLIGE